MTCMSVCNHTAQNGLVQLLATDETKENTLRCCFLSEADKLVVSSTMLVHHATHITPASYAQHGYNSVDSN